VVFVTGYDRSKSLRQGDKLASEIVLPKPFTASELSHVVRKKIDG